MPNRCRTAKAAALTMILIVGAAGCTGNSKKVAKPSGSAGGGASTTANSFNADLTATVNPSSKKGGTLNYCATSDFDSLDPGRTYYAYSWDFQRIWNRTVMAFSPTPGPDGTKVVPDLASAPGTVSADGLTWTYHLKSGLKFADGTPITSADVKYAIERVFATDVITGGPVQYYISLLDEGQNYKGPYKDHSPEGLKSVTTPDATTIVFHLKKPFSDFNYLMTLPVSTPVPSKIDQGPNGGAKYQFHVVATGPYMIKNYAPSKSLDLVRNPNWGNDSLRKALPDEIKLTEGLQSDTMDNQLLSGACDLEIESTGLQQTATARVLRDPTLKKYADNPLTGFVRYISIQQKVPPLTNVHCRNAVMYAADKVSLQFARGGPLAGGDIANSMEPPTFASYLGNSFNPFPDGPDNHGDLTKAKSELAACGHPSGFHTKIATTNTGKGTKTATALQQALARVGITTDIAAVDASTYYTGFIGTPANVHKNGLGLAVAGWGPDWPSFYGYWESIIDGRAIHTTGNSNYAELNDPAINDDIDKALAAKTPADVTPIDQDIQRRVMADAVLLPFVDDKMLEYHAPRLSNVYLLKAFGFLDFMNLGVS